MSEKNPPREEALLSEHPRRIPTDRTHVSGSPVDAPGNRRTRHRRVHAVGVPDGHLLDWLAHVGIMGSVTAALALLSFLARRALYAQVEETTGAVKVALSQIQRGWIIPSSPSLSRANRILCGASSVAPVSFSSLRVRPLACARC